MRIYKIEISLNDSSYDSFFVDASEFSVALDKAQNYIEVEKRRKDITRKDVLEIASISEEFEVMEIKNVAGKIINNKYE